jgi:hypothetical protein
MWAAMASSKVDFPVPFSPAKKVTRERKSSWLRVAMAGTQKG